MIGADRLIYQELEDLVAAVRAGNPRLSAFDMSCFNGEYVTGGVSRAYLDQLEEQRSDVAKEHRHETDEGVLSLHNAT